MQRRTKKSGSPRGEQKDKLDGQRSEQGFPLELIGNSLLNSPFKRGLGGSGD